MGCGELSKIKNTHLIPISMKPRISATVTRGQNLITRSQSLLPSRVNTSKILDTSTKICLKFKIFDEFHDFMAQETNPKQTSSTIAEEYRNDIKYIKNCWVLFKSAFSFFELTTHGSCIENFSIIDGIVIVLISNLASKYSFNSEIFILNASPYIQILTSKSCDEETGQLTKAWQGLSSAISKFSQKKMQKIEKIQGKFLKLLEQYSNYLPKNEEIKEIKQSKKNLQRILDSTAKLLGEVKENKSKVLGFIKNFRLRKQEIENLGQEAFENSCFSGEQIVHYVLAK